MRPVKPAGRRLRCPRAQWRAWHRQLVGLAHVSNVQKPLKSKSRAREAVLGEVPTRLLLHWLEGVSQPVCVHLGFREQQGAGVVLDDVGKRGPQRREHAGVWRRQHSLYSKPLGEGAGVHRARSPKGHKGKATRVETPLKGDGAQGPLHCGVGHSKHALCRRHHVLAKLFRELGNVEPGPLCIQRHPAVQEPACVQAAQDQVGVRHRHPLAAAVAGRPRIGPGGLRPHQQRAACVHPRYRTASRADGVNVYSGHTSGVAAYLGRGSLLHLPGTQRDVGGGAAHVQRDDLRESSLGRHVEGSHHPTGRAAEKSSDRLLRSLLRREAAPSRVHDAQSSADCLFEALQVSRHGRADVGVDHDCAGALVLPVLRQEVA